MDGALQVRQILSTRGLTLYHLSQQSTDIFGRSSPFYIPHNLYYDLRRGGSVPTIFQILALSHITNYRLPDWLAVFGFDLDAIPRLQMEILRKCTAMLDSTVYDTQAWIPWFVERAEIGAIPSIAPLGQLLAEAPAKRASDLLRLNRRKFLYASIGNQDWYALPYFAPGSTVRVDPLGQELLPGCHAEGQTPFFLVEHDSGWTCSRLTLLANDRVLLCCPQRPCAERELRIGANARILGVVDAEIRRLTPRHPWEGISEIAPLGKPRCDPAGDPIAFRGLLRRSRTSAGLSFREASSASRLIADRLSNELYFTAASTLSDYEVLSAPPRQTEKIITLCVLYCIGFDQFLRAFRFPVEQAGCEPIPDDLLPRQMRSRNHSLPIPGTDARDASSFLAGLVNQWEEVPLFLRFSFQEMTGLKRCSLSDVFWVGGDKKQRHRLLINATFVVVNRRARKPPPPGKCGVCEEPLYVILRRDGSYLCGHCTLDEGSLFVHSYPGGESSTQQFRDGTDAEVVGQVTTILRRLL